MTGLCLRPCVATTALLFPRVVIIGIIFPLLARTVPRINPAVLVTDILCYLMNQEMSWKMQDPTTRTVTEIWKGRIFDVFATGMIHEKMTDLCLGVLDTLMHPQCCLTVVSSNHQIRTQEEFMMPLFIVVNMMMFVFPDRVNFLNGLAIFLHMDHTWIMQTFDLLEIRIRCHSLAKSIPKVPLLLPNHVLRISPFS